MSSIFSTSVPSTPASSRTSRAAASAADSPGSMWPFGSASTVPSFTRTAAMKGRPRMFLTSTPPAENSRSVATRVLDQRDEAHGHHGLLPAAGVEASEALASGCADWANEPAVGRQLIHQRGGRLAFGRGRDGDAVEGRPVGRSAAAIAGADLHVVVAQLAQYACCLLGERSVTLDRHHLATTARKHGRRVAGARAYLECAVIGPELEQRGHRRHDPGLRDRLPLADAQRAVAVRALALLRRHEALARDLLHRAQHPLVGDATAAELSLHHLKPALGVGVSRCTVGAPRGHGSALSRART